MLAPLLLLVLVMVLVLLVLLVLPTLLLGALRTALIQEPPAVGASRHVYGHHTDLDLPNSSPLPRVCELIPGPRKKNKE